MGWTEEQKAQWLADRAIAFCERVVDGYAEITRLRAQGQEVAALLLGCRLQAEAVRMAGEAPPWQESFHETTGAGSFRIAADYAYPVGRVAKGEE